MPPTATSQFGKLELTIIENSDEKWYYGRRLTQITATCDTNVAAKQLLERLQQELASDQVKLTRTNQVVTIVIATALLPRVRSRLRGDSPELFTALVNNGWL